VTANSKGATLASKEGREAASRFRRRRGGEFEETLREVAPTEEAEEWLAGLHGELAGSRRSASAWERAQPSTGADATLGSGPDNNNPGLLVALGIGVDRIEEAVSALEAVTAEIRAACAETGSVLEQLRSRRRGAALTEADQRKAPPDRAGEHPPGDDRG
jgi:hypothetical protein